MSSTEPRTIPRPWPARQACRQPFLLPLVSPDRLDLAAKVLMPLLLLVLAVLAYRWGSFQDYLHLLESQTYTAILPALGAVYTLLMLFLQGLRTVLWAVYRPYPLSAAPPPQPHRGHSRLQ